MNPEPVQMQRAESTMSEGMEMSGQSRTAPEFSLAASPIQRQEAPPPPPGELPARDPMPATGVPGTDGSGVHLIDPWRAESERSLTNPTRDWSGNALPEGWTDGITMREGTIGDTEHSRTRTDTVYTASWTLGGETFSVEAYLIQGRSNERAMIVGGIHGSERGGVEVGERLLADIRAGRTPMPHYTLLLIPRLMAHNYARTTTRDARYSYLEREGGTTTGRGRGRRHSGGTLHRSGDTRSLPGSYTAHCSPAPGGECRMTDPNRQAPTLGSGVATSNPVDARGRPIEPENYIMVSLFNRYHPSRIVMLHGIQSRSHGGIFADPRAHAPNAGGEYLASGFDSDRDLTLAMARRADEHYIANGGTRGNSGVVPGNRASRGRGHRPVTDAIYHSDPSAAAAGAPQTRTDDGGRSWGGWFSTDVSDPAHPEQNRPAVTTITLETPEYYRSDDAGAPDPADRVRELQAMTVALEDVFLAAPTAAAVPAGGATP